MILDIRAMTSDPPELIERYKRGIKFDCFVDGKVIPFSFYADTTEGLVKAYSPDESGQLRACTDHSIIGEYEVRGKVEIKRRPVLGQPGSRRYHDKRANRGGRDLRREDEAGIRGLSMITVPQLTSLTSNFLLSEFACPCCSRVSADFRLVTGFASRRPSLRVFHPPAALSFSITDNIFRM